ncbi:MAG: DUF3291 domain-containing protein [Actinobacteria bacterium]|nr:DUF3291 domain-containing protein [Actinomycetota bacterium]
MTSAFHLAHLNIGRMLAPIGAPEVADFTAALDPINAIADAAPGFVWRLQTDEGNATALHVFEGDDLLLINMSLWESLEALSDFVYRSAHVDVMRRRREWFEKLDEAFMVLWWIPAGMLPDIEDAKRRLEHIRTHGPTPTAFAFRQSFPPDAKVDAVADVDDRRACPTG